MMPILSKQRVAGSRSASRRAQYNYREAIFNCHEGRHEGGEPSRAHEFDANSAILPSRSSLPAAKALAISLQFISSTSSSFLPRLSHSFILPRRAEILEVFTQFVRPVLASIVWRQSDVMNCFCSSRPSLAFLSVTLKMFQNRLIHLLQEQMSE